MGLCPSPQILGQRKRPENELLGPESSRKRQREGEAEEDIGVCYRQLSDLTKQFLVQNAAWAGREERNVSTTEGQ